MNKTPGSLRLHIGIFGRRNAGKSSLMNAIAGSDVSIVSETAGTTTDPVRRSLFIEPLGPVLLVDTPGIDDSGDLGALRINTARNVSHRVDMAIIVIESGKWGDFEKILLKDFEKNNVPAIIAVNKADAARPAGEWLASAAFEGLNPVVVSAETGEGLNSLMWQLVDRAPEEWISSPPVLKDLLKPGRIVVQVMPIDKEAPMGRILLPQVQAVREVADSECISLVTKETQLKATLESLKTPPFMVVTDSQAFGLVAPLTPEITLLTSYSILFARHKGDLPSFISGAMALEKLQDGDRVLMAEACVHHPIGNDIGRVQIPKRISLFAGKKLHFDFVQGSDYPDDLSPYRLIVHCGGCVFNRRSMLHRIQEARSQGVAVTNYGVLLARMAGVLERAIKPFFSVYPHLEKLFDQELRIS